jgi:hypothetical protein
VGDDTAAEQPSGLPAHLREDLKWKPGQSGNPAGRPAGARSKLTESFLEALLTDFQKASEEDQSLGQKAIAAMRADKPNEYARMIASILAKEVDANFNGDVSPELKRWLGIG